MDVVQPAEISTAAAAEGWEQQVDLDAQSAAAPSVLELALSSSTASRVLLHGGAQSGKTSLLFSHAHRLARRGGRVLLIALKDSLEQRLPVPLVPVELQLAAAQAVHSGRDAEEGLVSWDPAALSKIGIKYLTTAEDFRWWLSNVHTLADNTGPVAILIDDLDTLLSSSAVASGPAGATQSGGGSSTSSSSSADMQAGLYTLALLEDAAQFLNAAVLASVAQPAALPLAARVRYFPQQLHIEARQNEFVLVPSEGAPQIGYQSGTQVDGSSKCFIYRKL
jgi:hypothetical protein